MKYTRRQLVIMYMTFLFAIFFLSGLSELGNNKTEFEITCDNGTIERFNLSTKYICGGYENPLRKDIIEINFTLLIEKNS